MTCKKAKEDCLCPKTTCENHGKCCACVLNHRTKDSLTFCMFPDNEGSKSVESYYKKLKERFEK